jgi:hypothetical protein
MFLMINPLLPVVGITAGFLVSHGVLWSMRPDAGFWLAGSIVLGLLWGITFMRLITRENAND